ncbi:ABC transporter permease [Methanobrevibacter millerae]|uniref:Lipopolysaccharide transport system permease protein n=1 Tax=Methanobrevibacter millerae TaxID=230361 RepID=A0A1G5WU85_9EURY|nr:ABC transporter permease [Methanobrevibacter millerae]SDA61693.1 lipopolysaccharide transport system permease protein [Methanobrevibacter millerae]
MFETWDEKWFLLKQLVKRDFTTKYKESFLGIIWSFLNPLLIMIIFTVIFSVLFRREIRNFPVYFLTARIIYQFFVDATGGAMRSIRANRSILTKIFVPRYMFAISSICYEFINFLISLIILFGVMIVTGEHFHLMMFASIIPFIFLIIMIFGVGLILAVLNTYFSDIGHFYSIFALILMYASALFYPIEIVPANVQAIFTLNPLYIAISCFRDAIMYHVFPDILSLMYLAVFSVMLFGVGFLLFRIHEKKLVLQL